MTREQDGGAPEAGAGGETERLLTPAEVAAMFRVDPKTVTRWARDGRLTAVRTLGGHRRYHEAEVLELLRTAHSDGER
jgi:excisionase family DNA binding protein